MRYVFLGNALGYFTSMASSGRPPEPSYTVPPRGHLISYNELAAGWYDEANYKEFNLFPFLLVTFANSVGMHDRATFWANKGIDDARSNGFIAAIYPLCEALIPTMISEERIESALDYAYESATSFIASNIAFRKQQKNILESEDSIEILGTKPSQDWSNAEYFYLSIGVIPAIIYACTQELSKTEILRGLSKHCHDKAIDASKPTQFSTVAEAIDQFIAGCSSIVLHNLGLRENQADNAPARDVAYLLSSFSTDAHPRLAIIQHALVMHGYTRIPTTSVTWGFISDHLVSYWVRFLGEARFQFTNPSLVESALENLNSRSSEEKVKHLIQIILDGLSVQRPDELASTWEWLQG